MGFAQNIKESGLAISAFLAIGFIGIIFLIIFGNMSSSTIYGDHTSPTTTVTNHTSSNTYFNTTFIPYANSTQLNLFEVSCTLLNLTNSTSDQLIGSGNYTTGGAGGCSVQLTTVGSDYNGSSINSSFTFNSNTFQEPDNVLNNLTGGVNTFFGFSNTIFTILAITLLIIILLGLLALVMKVTKMSSGKKEGGGFSGF